jgi:TonB family protein
MAGCGSSSAVNHGRMVLHYEAPMATVADAMLAAMDSAGVAVTHVSGSRNVIVAKDTRREFKAVVTVSMVDSTNFVEARIDSEYPGYNVSYRHYPYDLYRRTRDILRPSRVSVLPERVFPTDSLDCRLNYGEDKSGDYMPAALVGGLPALSVQLSYSQEAEANHIEGQVIVTFVVDERGEVRCAQVDSGLPFGLNRRALLAVLASDFEPARRNGVPVATEVTLPLTFHLRKRR